MFELTEEEQANLDRLAKEHEEYMYAKYGKELVIRLLEELDKGLEEAMKKQFDNLVEIRKVEEE